MNIFASGIMGLVLAGLCSSARAEVKVVSDHNPEGRQGFRFKSVPPPSGSDAATRARLVIVDGERDANGGELRQLQDGRLPREEDQPSGNFFFRPGTDGGRLTMDLGTNLLVRQINSYSWHGTTRAPQVYMVYASDGAGETFVPAPRRAVDPQTCGWKLLAGVDTRPSEGTAGGQYGVSISDTSGSLGSYRYVLFDVLRTQSRDPFGNTFYSEIDVVDANAPQIPVVDVAEAKPVTNHFTAGDGKYHFVIDATAAPDLMAWAEQELRPVVQEWYPRIVTLLPSEGFSARTNVTIRFRDNMGDYPASAGGGYINCNPGWFRRELKREARGSVVHEMVHVVQAYGRSRSGDGQRMPGWLVEGIPDYIRWFLYEPETKGAEITARNLDRAKYDGSYRITGNFLNWVTQKYDTNIVRKLNEAGRLGRYKEGLWKEATGKALPELGAEWKTAHEERLAASNAAEPGKEQAVRVQER